MQTSGTTGAFIKKDVHPRLKGKGKSPLSESMKALKAPKKAATVKKAAPVAKQPERSLIGKGIDKIKGKMKEINDTHTRLKREQVDRHVDGKPNKRK